MKRIPILTLFAALLAISYVGANDSPVVSGQGKMKFKVLYKSDHLPPEAQKFLKGAHGGFAVDLGKGKGETYFALKGAGIIQISADLKSTRMVETAEDMKNTNLHNTTIWYAPDGKPHLLFPGNEANKVFVTGLDGKVDAVLTAPDAGVDLGNPVPNEYFKSKGPFVPTDVEQLDGKLYITTGYSKLDYVLTARILKTSPVELAWNNLSFGGKGTEPGQFDTGHGITVPPKLKRLDIADRANGEIDRFSPDGKYLSTIKMPKDSFPLRHVLSGEIHGRGFAEQSRQDEGGGDLHSGKRSGDLHHPAEGGAWPDEFHAHSQRRAAPDRQEVLPDRASLESWRFRHPGAGSIGNGYLVGCQVSLGCPGAKEPKTERSNLR